jgi:hypothetical protein
MPRYACKKDANHQQIVAALRRINAYVVDVSSLPGVLDLFVAYRGHWTWLEIKDGDKPKSDQKLTPLEVKALEDLNGRGRAKVVTNVTEAIQAIM